MDLVYRGTELTMRRAGVERRALPSRAAARNDICLGWDEFKSGRNQ